jgi:hypothetical protein
VTTSEKFAEQQRFDEPNKMRISKISSQRGDHVAFYTDLVMALGVVQLKIKLEQTRHAVRTVQLMEENTCKGCTLPFN